LSLDALDEGVLALPDAPALPEALLSLLELELAPPAADGDWVVLEPDAPALPDVLPELCD
jgi:hypothetical protein